MLVMHDEPVHDLKPVNHKNKRSNRSGGSSRLLLISCKTLERGPTLEAICAHANNKKLRCGLHFSAISQKYKWAVNKKRCYHEYYVVANCPFDFVEYKKILFIAD